MNRPGTFWRTVRAVTAALVLWAAGFVCISLGANRTTAALTLLLGVLAISTARDRVLAVISAISATLGLTYYYIEAPTGGHLSTLSAAIMLLAMLVTALTASELSIRAQRRADEADRRQEMERLQRFSAGLLGVQTVNDAATIACQSLVELFSVSRVVIRLGGSRFAYPPEPFSSAEPPVTYVNSADVVRVPLYYGGQTATLELYAAPPSAEVRSAIANLLGLVLDRARTFEEHAQMDAVRRGDELRSTILNAVAHDFRTPLTSIKAAASALRASSAAVFEPDRELIAVINEEADRLEALIRESLAIARLETLGETPAELCSIRTMVGSVTSRLARYLDRRQLEVDVPDDLPLVAGDRFLLELMFLQVVENAWKYSSPGARISIEAHAVNHSVAVSVWNEGLRIPDYEKQRIFDKFYRGAGDRNRTEGSGLGLAIAKSIVEAHRGAVSLEDGANGARFRFVLPVGQSENDVSEPHDPVN